VLEIVLSLGVVLGAAVTLLGGGGGVWYLLVLLALDVPYRVAVPTSLATVLVTTSFGSFGHLREGRVDGRVAVAVVAILGTSLAGVVWYQRLGTTDWSLAIPFGLAAGVGAFFAPRLYRVLPDESRLERGYRVVFTLLCGASSVAFLT
jgi:uncharacterized membrane protein YfcA